jgi:hypothetical protein
MAKPKRPKDFNERARLILDIVTGEVNEPKYLNGHKFEGQRLGGVKGGKARAEKLTPEERKKIAVKAANKRWGS